MNFTTIVVTRSKSCHIKTLHAILRINIKCLKNNVNNQIVYVNDDTFDKVEVIQKCFKEDTRIIFIDFGVGIDDETILQMFEKHENVGCLVFPCVREGIDWTLFKTQIKNNSSEKASQIGLHFDTDVGANVSKDIYKVKRTTPRTWFMNTKNVYKTIRDKKTGMYKLNPSNMFDKLIEQGVRIYAFSAAKLSINYPHECVSNILNAAGVKVN